MEKLHAGNLYINRVTTGAIVTRQPFGGMGKSAIGSGKKAGGFNYVSQFMNISYEDESLSHPYLNRIQPLVEKEDTISYALEKMIETTNDFVYWLDTHFNIEHDYSHIRGESNIIRYLSVKSVLFRFEDNDSLYEMTSSIAAAKMVGAKLYISVSPNADSEAIKYLDDNKDELLDKDDIFVYEDENALVDAMLKVERIRFLKPENVSPWIYEAVADSALYIASEPFVENGRIELMHYFIEQSISNSYHRYGNLGLRGLKDKEI